MKPEGGTTDLGSLITPLQALPGTAVKRQRRWELIRRCHPPLR